ncbi:HNH endonuclease [Longispora fulva]|nr:HNH endonuclease signature motif containing protein [Longispora fulva]
MSERASRAPQIFRTVREAEFPYEHSWFPIVGDVIERHGVTSHYVPLDQIPWLPDHLAWVLADTKLPAARVLGVLCPDARMWTVHFIETTGETIRLAMAEVWAYDTPTGQRTYGSEPLTGVDLYQGIEMIKDVDDAGQEYQWDATVFSPARPEKLWTPARMDLSQKRSRTTRAKNAYQARKRALGIHAAAADEVDPQDIYDRDDWICQLCQHPVERRYLWPHPMSITLDHVLPVTRGGSHSTTNLQTAHWICNLRKGNAP